MKPADYRPALHVQALLLALALAALGGCANDLSQGISLIDEGSYEAGLAQLEAAAAKDPRDPSVQIALATQKARVITMLLTQADNALTLGDQVAAYAIFQRVLRLESTNTRAQQGMRKIEQMQYIADFLRQGQAALRRGDLVGAETQVRAILELDPLHPGARKLRDDVGQIRARTDTMDPQLRGRLQRLVTLEFRDANLGIIFEVLSQTAGLNFILDKDIRPDLKATIFVRDVSIADAVELITQQNQLHQRIINDNTIIIYPDSPQKLKEYQELVMRSFYLTNIGADAALNMIKTLLKTRDIFVDERLNTLTMRDTPDVVRMVEKLLFSQDQPDPEVVLEIEIMEVSQQRILDLGLQWPNTFGVVNAEGGAITVLDQLRGIDSGRITLSPSPQLRINEQDNDINTLASPVIRVRNKEQARIHIGQRVPIISATSVPSTQGPVITESITYLDVGLKLEVQPTIYLNDVVGIQIALEVSNATPLEATRQGTIPVQVDTRNAVTTLSLKNGETQLLAGLVRNDHGVTGNQIPGIGDVPGLGRLFGSRKDTIGKSELVLSITPRIVRNLPYQSPGDMEFATGTESHMRSRPVTLNEEQPRAPVEPLELPDPVDLAPAVSEARPL
ncbi:secretin N-terminal domain-containing protein [Halopseudomonas pelagia]|uniref:Secretion type II protein n=1 Tax=Halopseudomonas pelagia TaxID=553151 RepID=A0AA91Z519_9GAMM|nr:secretin N-terminal domain-containing protein [Halopseudomonas pelagia]PCC98522.1 secretion type II protein [Halopseudomonas pelagia]QFY57456.1 secretion type II protein [Halopseudomonas pelagia]